MGRDLLNNILQIDPNKRYNIEKILTHPWCTHSKCELDKGLIIGVNETEIDYEIVKEIYKNIDRYKGNKSISSIDDIVINIRENQQSCLTTA